MDTMEFLDLCYQEIKDADCFHNNDETRFPATPLPYEPYNPNHVWYKNEPYCTVTSTNSVKDSYNRIGDQ